MHLSNERVGNLSSVIEQIGKLQQQQSQFQIQALEVPTDAILPTGRETEQDFLAEPFIPAISSHKGFLGLCRGG